MSTSRPPETGALPTLTPTQAAALRVRCGLSMVQWADALGVSDRTVRSWESGRDGMSPGSVAAVWRLVGEHDALVDRLRAGDAVLGGDRPRQWYLAAYGRVLGAD